MGQSSNDSFPDGHAHRRGVRRSHDDLIPALRASAPGRSPQRPTHSPTSSRSAAPICRMPRRSPSARSSPATPPRSRCGIARVEACLPRSTALAQGGTAVGTGLNAHAGLRRGFRRRAAAADRPALRHRAQQVRGPGRPRRHRRGLRRAQHARRLADQDRQRHPPARLRPALRHRRVAAAGERARLLDHAGQGQSDPGRGADHGRRPRSWAITSPSPSPAARDISS